MIIVPDICSNLFDLEYPAITDVCAAEAKIKTIDAGTGGLADGIIVFVFSFVVIVFWIAVSIPTFTSKKNDMKDVAVKIKTTSKQIGITTIPIDCFPL